MSELTSEQNRDVLDNLVKDLTGLDFDHPKELLQFLQNQHTIIHDRYNLPSDELMTLGKQQQYLDQLTALIDQANVYLNFGKTKKGTSAQYNPKETFFTSHPPRTYRGVITIHPEKIDITDGIQINRALGHEYIHVLQIKNKDTFTRLELKKMEFEAYVGSTIMDEHINVRNLFSTISQSVKTSCVQS
jgi:hypothetical protein